jgi:hypothetical protein
MEREHATPREDPHSLAPVQIEVVTLEEDIAKLNRGKGTRLVLSALLSGLAVFGIVQWMDTIDGQQAYAAAAERLETIHAQQGNALLRCVLPDVQRSQVGSRQALHTALEVASERAQKRYGKQLQHCTGLSEELVRQVNDLEVPADMVRRAQGLRSAAGDLDQALGTYRAYLIDSSKPYDFVQATPMIERLANAWTTYEEQRAAINQALRDHP